MPVPPERRVGNGVSDIRALSVWATGSGGQRAPSAPSAPTPTPTAAATPGGLAGGARRRSVAALPLPTLSAGHSGLKYKLASGTGETGAVFDGESPGAKDAPEWSVHNAKCCGWRASVAVWGFHAAACALHIVLFVVTIAFSAGVDDPFLPLWRQRFIFTRNTTLCGRDSFQEQDESRIVAVLEPSGSSFHVGWASACFFLLSCAVGRLAALSPPPQHTGRAHAVRRFCFHGIWVVGGFCDALGDKLFAMLDSAFVPLRWMPPAPHPCFSTLSATSLLQVDRV